MRRLPLPTGKFGKLTPLALFQQPDSEWLILCVCDCGALCTPTRHDLRRRPTLACGCGRQKHLHTYRNGVKGNSREYSSWRGMKDRCNNPNTISYKNYGARGIGYSQRWELFANFLADMGPRPEGTTLNRLDVDKDYGPDNCNWATSKEQNNPANKRNKHKWDWELHAEDVAA